MASMIRKDRYPLSSSSRRDMEKERAAAVTERLKTVVRRLPANLPEDVFWQSVQEWVTDETVLWKVFYPGKSKKRINKENIPSRAYIAFKNEELVAQFSKEYDGHVFRDKQGNESQAVVEFAPYQKISPEKKKVDARNATIEKDEDYISFMASLNQVENVEPVSVESLIAANQPPPMPKTTPLLEALKAEKSSKDILRTHAQYKDATILRSTTRPRNLAAVSATKDDTSGDKKVAQPPPPPFVKDSTQPDSGKKGKKAQAAAAKQQQGPQMQPTPVSNATKKEPPPFKPHKLARQQAAAAKAAAAATQAQAQASSQRKVEEVLPVSASSSGDGSATVAPATGGVAAQVSAAAAASRRVRPVVGLASRQLQAALSQVGASALERKRREREAEKGTSPISPEGVGNSSPIVAEGTTGKGKEPERAISATSGVTSPPPPETSNASGKEIRERPKQTPPTSPRHDRTRRREKSGHQADPGVKVPSIMQRPEGMPPPASQRDASSQVLPSAVQVQTQIPALDGSANSPPLRSGPRRGRGRGRGQRGG
ncbi:hypothetical protein M378DRAFT_535188 [Amanita muscaria Koide BX008]|uniref:UPF3 domain-containing protein n=1 Tax=Amanita muscaria (strain Koide BX008) TaxID=946122 RepID=A0A0C2X7G6_AMAMK|nr:hypothetical protein M378DRAFT_535188 [Amanita muscaria Koide BX008]